MNQDIKKERLQNRLEPEIQEFRDSKKTLQLATVDSEGKPNVSYAPFVLLNDGYYVLISEIARHTRNLMQNTDVSLMLIEDEESSKLLFARKRLTFDATAILIDRDEDKWQEAVTQMRLRFGEIIDGLSSLEDFKMFRLKPIKGLFVKGFGQAFQVSGDDLVDFVHLEQGHKKYEKA